MQRSDNVRPIIIKRKKIIAAGHHGGAWKVAYADFVTAMMAFFLMLWLLGSTDDDQRKGIADYFSPTVMIESHSSGAEQLLGGESLSPVSSINDNIATREAFEKESAKLVEIAEMMSEMIAQDPGLADLLAQIAIRLTDEGLVIELFDLDTSPLFEGQTAEASDTLTLLSDLIANAFAMVSNPIAVTAHSRSFPAVLREDPVWPLTTARALAMQGLLGMHGTEETRFHRVTGHADRALATDNPMASRNNRIEVTLLRRVTAARD